MEIFKLFGTIMIDNAEAMASLSKVETQAEKLAKSLQTTGDSMKKAGGALTKLMAPLAGIGIASTKAAVDFESAFAGVRKTVDGTEEEFAALKDGIMQMATELPASQSEIAAVAEAAGQLGIKKEAILGFTRTMVDLGVATNLTADEAATQLARLANITQMPQDQFGQLGATIVALGNNLATTEAEIVAMGLRLAGAGAQIGLSEAETLALAGALSSVGIEAEAGGSAFSKLMVNMQLAAETGTTAHEYIAQTGKSLRELELLADANGEAFKGLAQDLGLTSGELKGYMSTASDLEAFASVTGQSADEFTRAFQEDAVGTIGAFIEGLATAEERGVSAIAILDEMGITEVRLRDSLLRASGAQEVFADAVALGTQAWDQNVALTKEAEQRYATSASQMEMFGNKVRDVGITLGEALVPALLKALDAAQPFLNAIKGMAEWFANLDPHLQTVIIGVVAAATALGPLLIVVGHITTAISALVPVIAAVKAAISATFVATAGTPIGIAIAVAAALIAAWQLVYNNWDAIKTQAGALGDAIGAMVDSVVGFFAGLPDKVEQQVKAMANRVATWFTNIKDKNIERMKLLWEGIVEKFDPENLLTAIKDGFAKAVTYLTEDVPKAFIQGGINIINSFITGLMNAARKIPVVGGDIANFLGQYLIGQSPPPKGPLHLIDVGGYNTIMAWIDGMRQAMPEVATMADSIAGAVSGVFDSIPGRMTNWIGDVTQQLWDGTATWESVLGSFAGVVGDLFNGVFGAITKEMVANIVAQSKWLTDTAANIAKAIGAYIAQAFAALSAFFGFLGPFAPVAAGAVIAAVIAGVAALGGSLLRGLLPKAPGGSAPGVPGKGSSGGKQVSELSGPSRDLLTDLLAPLASLNAIVGPIQGIRDILDARLPDFGGGLAMAGAGGVSVSIGQLTVQGGAEGVAGSTVDAIERAIAERLTFAQRGRGIR